MPNWSRIIKALKRLISEIGPVWPGSTKLSGYGEDGPYHCEDCKYLLRHNGRPVMNEQGRGKCFHPVVKADVEVQSDSQGFKLVSISTGCCEFVDQSDHAHKEGS